MKFRGSLKEIGGGLDISQPEVLNYMEKACGEKVKLLMTNTLEKAKKEYKVDTFGIGALVHRTYPEIWREIQEDWPNIFKKLEYTIEVDARINDTGYTNKPPNIRKDKNGK